MTDGPARLIELYFEHWLRNSKTGRRQIARLGFDGAMDALWELLNAGFIKLEGNEAGFTNIVPCNPPRPPASPLVRPPDRIDPGVLERENYQSPTTAQEGHRPSQQRRRR